MLFFPPFFAGVILHDKVFLNGLLPFVLFCLASSAAYVFNDISDIERDRAHPDKMHRPLASGAVTVRTASMVAAILFLGSLIIAALISVKFFLYLAFYLVITAAYSLFLKNYPVIDLFCISSGFLLRLMAGGEVFEITVSEWLFLSVFLLAIFLSSGKRLAEKQNLGRDAGVHRKTLLAYPGGFLEGVMCMTGGAVLVTYTLYVISRSIPLLLYSVPLCCFGLLRYMLRVQSDKGGDPTEALTRDVQLLIVGILWVVIVGSCIYGIS